MLARCFPPSLPVPQVLRRGGCAGGVQEAGDDEDLEKITRIFYSDLFLGEKYFCQNGFSDDGKKSMNSKLTQFIQMGLISTFR